MELGDQNVASTDTHGKTVTLASGRVISLELLARAWRDDEFFDSLDPDISSELPSSPVGNINFRVVENEGVVNPLRAGSVAASCSTVAASCSTVAASCSTVAASCSTISANCSSVAATCSTVAAKCSSVAATCSTVAAKCSTVAATCSTVAASCSTIAANCGSRRRR
jgi:mersacidin/lichenicidin family type 2 lantibiotic